MKQFGKKAKVRKFQTNKLKEKMQKELITKILSKMRKGCFRMINSLSVVYSKPSNFSSQKTFCHRITIVISF